MTGLLRTASIVLLATHWFAGAPLVAQASVSSELPAGLSKLRDVELHLVQFRSNDKEVVIPSGAVITLTFRRDGQISGRSAVNNYAGRFTAQEDGAIAIQLTTSTQMAGAAELMKLEREYFEALSHAGRFSLKANQVVLENEATSLTFTSGPSK